MRLWEQPNGDGWLYFADGKPVASVQPRDGAWVCRNLTLSCERANLTFFDAVAMARRIARILVL